jgi:hypothetical protein
LQQLPVAVKNITLMLNYSSYYFLPDVVEFGAIFVESAISVVGGGIEFGKINSVVGIGTNVVEGPNTVVGEPVEYGVLETCGTLKLHIVQ